MTPAGRDVFNLVGTSRGRFLCLTCIQLGTDDKFRSVLVTPRLRQAVENCILFSMPEDRGRKPERISIVVGRFVHRDLYNGALNASNLLL